jgi:drug/metabolite transporter (DMT)-like permease
MKSYEISRKMKRDNHKLGIILMIFTGLFFALIAFIIKILDEIPLMEIVLFRNFPSMLIIPIIIIKQKISILGRNKPLLVSRGLLGALGMIAMFYTYTAMPITDSIAIQRLSPFFIIIMSIIFLHERYNIKQFPIILTAFIGALLVIKPGFRTDIFPAIVALISAILMGSAHVVVRYLRLIDNYWVIINYFAYIAGITSIISLMWNKNFVIPDTKNIFLLLILGLVALGAQICLTLSYRFAPASIAAPYLYTQIIFAAILEITCLGIMPDLLTFVGSAIIIISGIMNFKFSQNNSIEQQNIF